MSVLQLKGLLCVASKKGNRIIWMPPFPPLETSLVQVQRAQSRTFIMIECIIPAGELVTTCPIRVFLQSLFVDAATRLQCL